MLGGLTSRLRRWGITDRFEEGFDLGLRFLGDFAEDVAHLMRPAAPAQALLPHRVHRAQQPRCPIRRDGQRRRQPSFDEVAQAVAPALVALAVADAQVQQNLYVRLSDTKCFARLD